MRIQCSSMYPSFIPYLTAKAKANRHNIASANSKNWAFQPDLLLCRTSQPLEEAFRQKIALLCGISEDYIFEGLDTKCIDEIPLNFERQGMGTSCSKNASDSKRDHQWMLNGQQWLEKLSNPKHKVRVAVVGKYTSGSDGLYQRPRGS